MKSKVLQMNLLLNLLPRNKKMAVQEQIVNRVAARSQSAVWQKIERRAMTMGPAEARGYVRARAALVVERELDIAKNGKELAERSELLESALERVVVQTLDQLRIQHLERARHVRAA